MGNTLVISCRSFVNLACSLLIWLCLYSRLFNLMGYNKADLLGDVVFTFHHHDDTDATLECSRGSEEKSNYYMYLYTVFP